MEVVYNSKDPKSRTGIQLVEGTEYHITALEITPWYDATIAAGVDGWKKYLKLAKLFGKIAKVKSLPFYHLTGCVAGSCFTIGKGSRIKITQSGELILFVNDVPYFFWNNSGLAKVTVTEI